MNYNIKDYKFNSNKMLLNRYFERKTVKNTLYMTHNVK